MHKQIKTDQKQIKTAPKHAQRKTGGKLRGKTRWKCAFCVNASRRLVNGRFFFWWEFSFFEHSEVRKSRKVPTCGGRTVASVPVGGPADTGGRRQSSADKSRAATVYKRSFSRSGGVCLSRSGGGSGARGGVAGKSPPLSSTTPLLN